MEPRLLWLFYDDEFCIEWQETTTTTTDTPAGVAFCLCALSQPDGPGFSIAGDSAAPRVTPCWSSRLEPAAFGSNGEMPLWDGHGKGGKHVQTCYYGVCYLVLGATPPSFWMLCFRRFYILGRFDLDTIRERPLLYKVKYKSEIILVRSDTKLNTDFCYLMRWGRMKTDASAVNFWYNIDTYWLQTGTTLTICWSRSLMVLIAVFAC